MLAAAALNWRWGWLRMLKTSPKVTLYEDKSRGAGCDALDNSGNVVDANSADHCCQGEDYCCDYGSCASDWTIAATGSAVAAQ